jgi:hypothetical protein
LKAASPFTNFFVAPQAFKYSYVIISVETIEQDLFEVLLVLARMKAPTKSASQADS